MVKGARILRVHDVAETIDVVRMIAAVESAE
jgi:dihydropteroate synthase